MSELLSQVRELISDIGNAIEKEFLPQSQPAGGDAAVMPAIKSGNSDRGKVAPQQDEPSPVAAGETSQGTDGEQSEKNDEQPKPPAPAPVRPYLRATPPPPKPETESPHYGYDLNKSQSGIRISPKMPRIGR